ncbi:MAG TPA: response regulator transcription factor [Acidobacteriota bacterium]|nr:response regulator transcription factor [Acidobacteriota bacterium]
MKLVRILLADDHPHVLEKVRQLLASAYEIVGTASDGQSLVNAVGLLKPDVLVIDITMPILNGIEAAEQLRDDGCESKIIFLTVHADPDYVRACLAAGAFGYVVKARMSSDLPHAIQEALAGRIFISPPASSLQ